MIGPRMRVIGFGLGLALTLALPCAPLTMRQPAGGRAARAGGGACAGEAARRDESRDASGAESAACPPSEVVRPGRSNTPSEPRRKSVAP